MSTAVFIVDSSGSSPWWKGYAQARSEVWYDATTVYVFYFSSSAVAYKKSTDSGLTFGSAVALCEAQVDFDIYYERWSDASLDPIVHVIGHDDGSLGAGGRALRYTAFTLSADTVSDAYPGRNIQTMTANPYTGSTAIGVARNGDIHVVSKQLTGAAAAYHLISTNGGASFAASADPDFGQAVYDTNYLVPDGSSGDTADMLVFGLRPTGDTLVVVQWDSSAGLWLSPVTIRSGLSYEVGLLPRHMNLAVSYVRTTGHCFVLVYDHDDYAGASPAAATLYAYDVNGTASVTARTNVLTAISYAQACAAMVMPGASGLWYAFYARGAAADTKLVYFKTSADSGATWSAEQLYSTAAVMDVAVIYGEPSSLVTRPRPAYGSSATAGVANDIYIEAGFLEAAIETVFTLSGTLTGGTAANPPILVRCKHLDGINVIRVRLDSRRVA